MDSDSECDRRSVSKANTTRMFEARAREKKRKKKKKKQEKLVWNLFTRLDPCLIWPLSGYKTFLDVVPEDRYQETE